MIINLKNYEKHLKESGALEKWENTAVKYPEMKDLENERLNAEECGNTTEANRIREAQNEISDAAIGLSQTIFKALGENLHPQTVLVIGNSTGKDSTAVMSLTAQWLKEQKKSNSKTPKTIVTIADTRTEFPLMAKRMEEEKNALNLWAEKHGFDLECYIQAPAVKSRLLVEFIGNGKPLPALGQSTGSKGPSNWCMDRVKAGPIDTILKMVRGKGNQFMHALGTRFAESTKRASTMDRHGEGMPYGIAHMKLENGKQKAIPNSLCFQPIAHWPDWMPFRYLENTMIPWDPTSVEKLKEAYDLAAPKGGKVSECGLRLTEDGSYTSVCQGLDGSGARMGCWMCFKVKNKSLINMAKRDQRFQALKDFHDHIMEIHKKDKKRREQIKATGFDSDTLCPRTFLFRERYYTLMLLFKAVIESGFEDLIREEELEQIEKFWNKHGVFTITTEMARQDAEHWVKTGVPTISWENNTEWMTDLGSRLSEGLNLTAYWHILNPEYQPLDWQRLLCVQEISTPLIPRLQSYIFKNWEEDSYTVMVTDCLGPVVTKSNKWIIDDLVKPEWDLIQIRETNRFERELSDGKSIFYTVKGKETCQKAEEYRLKHESGETLEEPELHTLDIAYSILDTLDFEERQKQTQIDEEFTKPLIIRAHFKKIPKDTAQEIMEVITNIDPIIWELVDNFDKNARTLAQKFPNGVKTEEELKNYRKQASYVFGVRKGKTDQKDLFLTQAPLELIERYIKAFKRLGGIILKNNIHPVVLEKLLDLVASSETPKKLMEYLSEDFQGEEPDVLQLIPESHY